MSDSGYHWQRFKQGRGCLLSYCTNQSPVLYEQYLQRHVVREIQARTNLAYSRNDDPSRSSVIDASPQPRTGSDATNNPPADVPAPSRPVAISSLKERSSSATASGQTLRSKRNETALMPEYKVVHNHCSRITGNLPSLEAKMNQELPNCR